jgi:hypothetical protein
MAQIPAHAEAARPALSRSRRAFETAAALALYAALSVGLFGRGVVAGMNERVVGDAGADKTLYMWSLEWWPHALTRGRNPLDVSAAWAPHGFDLGLDTAGGGLAVAAAPLTGALGPVPTYNLLMLAAPALAATSAFVLSHRLTQSYPAALVGGYIFGFSSYELGHLIGHLPLTFVALLPLAPYLVLRRHQGEISRGPFLTLLGAVFVAQFLIVPQLFFSLVLMAVVAGVAAVVVLGKQAVRRTLIESGLAVAAATILVSPIVAYALTSTATAPARSPFSESADLLNYIVPTRRTWLRPPGSAEIAERFTGTGAEQGAYLGVPFLVLAALAVVSRPRSRPRILAGIVLLAAVGLSLGTRIKVAGEVVGIAPWAALAPFPVVGSALPNRLTVYTALFAGVLVALALADRRTVSRWLFVATGVAATLPNLQLPVWSADAIRPEFFAQGRDVRFVADGATVLVLPHGPAGWSMLWQAEAGFRFRLVGGHLGLRVTPPERRWRDVYEALGTGDLAARRLRSFIAAHGVSVVIVAPGTRGRVVRVVEAAVNAEPVHALDALVYRVRPALAPARTTR